MSKNVARVISLASLALTLPLVAMAAGPSTYVTDVIERLLGMVVWPIFIGVIVIMFLWAGILFLTAQGDPGKIATARKAVIWGVVGIAVAILGYSAYSIINNIIPPPPA